MGRKIEEPRYVVYSPFTQKEKYHEFVKYEEAVEYGTDLSNHIPVQIRIDFVTATNEEGERVAVCQDGQLLQVYQLEFLDVEKPAERKMKSDMGRTFWAHLAKTSQDIRDYRCQVRPLTNEESEDLYKKQEYLEVVFQRLKQELTEVEFESIKYKLIDKVIWKNRVPDKPKPIVGFSDSQLRKKQMIALIKSADIMIRERWSPSPDMMFRVLQAEYNEAMKASKARKHTKTSTHKEARQKKKLQNQTTITLFDVDKLIRETTKKEKSL